MSYGICSGLAPEGESLLGCLAETRESRRRVLVSRRRFSLWMQGRGERVVLLEVAMGVGRGLAKGDCALILYMFLFSKYKSNNRHCCQ